MVQKIAPEVEGQLPDANKSADFYIKLHGTAWVVRGLAYRPELSDNGECLRGITKLILSETMNAFSIYKSRHLQPPTVELLSSSTYVIEDLLGQHAEIAPPTTVHTQPLPQEEALLETVSLSTAYASHGSQLDKLHFVPSRVHIFKNDSGIGRRFRILVYQEESLSCVVES